MAYVANSSLKSCRPGIDDWRKVGAAIELFCGRISKLAFLMARSRLNPVYLPTRQISIGWPELLLLISSSVLLFQLFPGIWLRVLHYADVRNWTWRAYAVTCGVWVICLFVIKLWRDNAANRKSY